MSNRKLNASCAECKRLKIRCNKQAPCDSCLRRGCGHICPDGNIATGDGHRAFWASTGGIRGKLSDLAERVRVLEDALTVFDARHPLLSSDLRQVKDAFLDRNTTTASASATAVGSTSLYDQTSGVGLTSLFPFWISNEPRLDLDEACLQGFLGALPPRPRAATLLQLYHQEVAWKNDPISVEELESDVFGPLYDQPESSAPSVPLSLNVRVYRLATMFMVFAIAEQFENVPPSASHNYCRLALVVLARSPVMEEPTVEAIQALVLMTIYWSYSKPSNRSANQLWMINGLALKLAESLLLHNESGFRGLSVDEVARRRRLMSEVRDLDGFMSMCLSRSPSLYTVKYRTRHYPVRVQSDDDIFFSWRTNFASECASKVALVSWSFSGTQDSAELMQLDAFIRSYPLPPLLRLQDIHQDPLESKNRPRVFLQRMLAGTFRQRLLFAVHYSHCDRALNDMSQSPLTSPFRDTVLAGYACSLESISMTQRWHLHRPESVAKSWIIWRNVLDFATVIGRLIDRCPDMPAADAGLAALNIAATMFSQVQEWYGSQPLSTIQRLLSQAQHSVDEVHYQLPPSIGCPPHLAAPPQGSSCLYPSPGNMDDFMATLSQELPDINIGSFGDPQAWLLGPPEQHPATLTTEDWYTTGF